MRSLHSSCIVFMKLRIQTLHIRIIRTFKNRQVYHFTELQNTIRYSNYLWKVLYTTTRISSRPSFRFNNNYVIHHNSYNLSTHSNRYTFNAGYFFVQLVKFYKANNVMLILHYNIDMKSVNINYSFMHRKLFTVRNLILNIINTIFFNCIPRTCIFFQK